jgi:hypothetical protein
MPAALNFGTRAISSFHVFGGCADLGEQVLVVVDHHGLDAVVRQRVRLAVHLADRGDRGQEALLDRGVLGEVADVLDRAGGHVRREHPAAPAVDQRGRLLRADGRPDLLLVRVVRELLDGELLPGVCGVP